MRKDGNILCIISFLSEEKGSAFTIIEIKDNNKKATDFVFIYVFTLKGYKKIIDKINHLND